MFNSVSIIQRVKRFCAITSHKEALFLHDGTVHHLCHLVGNDHQIAFVVQFWIMVILFQVNRFHKHLRNFGFTQRDGGALHHGIKKSGLLPIPGLPTFEKQQVLVRPGFIKGIVYIPFPGYPVKVLWGLHLDAVRSGPVAHELAHRLLAK